MAIGFGFYLVALYATLLVFLTLSTLRYIENKIHTDDHQQGSAREQ